MFEALKNLVMGSRRAPDAPAFAASETQLAEAALMFHVIAADGVVTADEKRRLEDLLATEFDLTAKQTRELVEEAKAADAEAIDLYAFTRTLKRELDADARLELIRRLWVMVYADGDVHEFEDNIVWRVAELLDIDSRARMEIKQQVRGDEGNG